MVLWLKTESGCWTIELVEVQNNVVHGQPFHCQTLIDGWYQHALVHVVGGEWVRDDPLAHYPELDCLPPLPLLSMSFKALIMINVDCVMGVCSPRLHLHFLGQFT